MRYLPLHFALWLCLPLACGVDDPVGPTTQFEISAATLELSGVGAVDYAISVESGLGEIVWTRNPLSTTAYGDGMGGLSYAGPCDASPGAEEHTVYLSILEVYDDGDPPVPLTDYINPCPMDAPCRREAVCEENRDTPVRFDLTLMRAAKQGFFDIRVFFNEIYCSAKFDTCYDPYIRDTAVIETRLEGQDVTITCYQYRNGSGQIAWAAPDEPLGANTTWRLYDICDAARVELGSTWVGPGDTPPGGLGAYELVQSGEAGPIALLYGRDANGNLSLGHTGVLALSCTTGAAENPRDPAEATHLYMTDVLVVCDDPMVPASFQAYHLDTSEGPGNVYQGTDIGDLAGDVVWQYASYTGIEQVQCGGQPCNKIFWNMSFGIEGLPANCMLGVDAMAHRGPMPMGATPPHSNYPVIQYRIRLTDEAGGVICDQNPLLGEGSGVQPTYFDSEVPIFYPTVAYEESGDVTIERTFAGTGLPLVTGNIQTGVIPGGTFNNYQPHTSLFAGAPAQTTRWGSLHIEQNTSVLSTVLSCSAENSGTPVNGVYFDIHGPIVSSNNTGNPGPTFVANRRADGSTMIYWGHVPNGTYLLRFYRPGGGTLGADNISCEISVQ